MFFKRQYEIFPEYLEISIYTGDQEFVWPFTIIYNIFLSQYIKFNVIQMDIVS